MKTITIIMVLLITSICYPLSFAGGTGTSTNPYLISTAEQLNNVRNYLGSSNSDKYFVMMDDINLRTYLQGDGYNNEKYWLPIGNSSNQFKGKFNGNGKKITYLKINRYNEAHIGLFGCLGSGGKIENLGVEIDNISSVTGSYQAGGLVGKIESGGIVINCYVKGKVMYYGPYDYSTGILVGENSGTISNCYANGTAEGKQWVGGLVGYNNGLVENSYSVGNVRGEGTDIGGLIGGNVWTGGTAGSVTNCYSSASVEGQGNVMGGLIGYNNQGIITNSYSYGVVDMYGYAPIDGGLIGKNNSGTYNNCFWDMQASYKSTSAGGTAKSTEEMKLKSTFNNWDFPNTWSIEEPSNGAYSYPYLTNNPQVPIPGIVNIFAGGNGEASSPWRIQWAAQLNAVREYLGIENAAKHFILINDIDLATYFVPGADGYNDGAFWQPIGDFTDQFHGKLNGDGYKVAYLKVNREATDYIGLFGVIGSNGKVENLGVEVVTSTLVNGNNYVGSIVGCNYGTLENIYAIGEGTIKGNQDVGGLAGSNEGTIKTSYSTSIVEGIQNVGGFVGTNINATIENCYSRSDVTRTSETNTNFGAFCGNNDNSTIKFSYCTGSVSYEFPTFPSDKGFIGNSVGSSYLGNFFDNQISNQSTATGATGNTTIEMTNSTSTNNIYLNAGWDFKGESNNGTQSIWNIGHGRNDTYPYQSIFYTNDPPSINTIQSTHSLPIGNSSPAPITFTGTGVTIDFSGVSGATGADDITISKYNEAPTVLTGAIGSEVNIAGTSFLFTNNSGFTFTSTIQFLVSDIPGVNTALLESLNNGDATDIKFWKRPEYGSGEFTNLGFLLYNKGADNINGTADDYLYLEGVTSFSEFTFSSGTHVLPVELTSFTASVSENKVTLNWQTATEINNYGFEIERLVVSCQPSVVSGQRTDEWEVIGFVEGHGNNNSIIDYSFIDDNLMSGKYSYRLKQIDNDGGFSCSEIVNVEIGEVPTIFSLSQNYPNPFNPITRIKYSIPANHSHSTLRTVSLKVYDILGNEVATLVNEAKAPGHYQVEWNATGFATGVYFYSLHAGTFTSVKKLILLR